jgi:hypothetical protein
LENVLRTCSYNRSPDSWCHSLHGAQSTRPFANQTETLPYSSSHGNSIPVWYTNHPAVVSDWLSENIPNSNGILGFDVEVREDDIIL